MSAATATEKTTRFKIPKLPKIGDWVFFYNKCRVHHDPVPAIVTTTPNTNGSLSLTAFTPSGPMVSTCMPAGSPLLATQDVREYGCWSNTRIDLKKS